MASPELKIAPETIENEEALKDSRMRTELESELQLTDGENLEEAKLAEQCSVNQFERLYQEFRQANSGATLQQFVNELFDTSTLAASDREAIASATSMNDLSEVLPRLKSTGDVAGNRGIWTTPAGTAARLIEMEEKWDRVQAEKQDDEQEMAGSRIEAATDTISADAEQRIAA